MATPRPPNVLYIPLRDVWEGGGPLREGWKLVATLERRSTAGITGSIRVHFGLFDEKDVNIQNTNHDVEDYETTPAMFRESDPVRFIGYAPLERGAPPTILVPVAASGASFDYTEMGHTFSFDRNTGVIVERGAQDDVTLGMGRPITRIGPGRRLVADESYITKLVEHVLRFRRWYQAGGPSGQRREAEEKRLGRAEVLVELRPGSGIRRGNNLVEYFSRTDRPILVEWFPDSGTDTVRVTLPNSGILWNEGQPRADHVELFRVSALFAELSASRYIDAAGSYVNRNDAGVPVAVLHGEVKLDIVNAWNARRRSGSGDFPMRVTLERAMDRGDPNINAYATVTVERRFAGKYKGMPLLSVTVNPADYSVGGWWAPNLFPPGRTVRTRQRPFVYGPYTVQQVMQGTSRAAPGRWEMTRTVGSKGTGGYLEYTGWMVSVGDVQKLLVALDRRQEQGLGGLYR